MTSPTYQSTTVTDFGADATTHNAVMPATVNAGDLLLALVGFDGVATITTPSGWTHVGGMIDANQFQNLNFAIFAKVADGSEEGANVNFVTDTSQRGTAHVIRASGWRGSLDGIVCAVSMLYNTNPAFVLGWGSAQDVLLVVFEVKSSVTGWSSGPPSGYSNNTKTNVSEDSTSSCSIASATKTASAALREQVLAPWDIVTGWTWGLVAIMPTATAAGAILRNPGMQGGLI